MLLDDHLAESTDLRPAVDDFDLVDEFAILTIPSLADHERAVG